MAIFNSYVKLPEGTFRLSIGASKNLGTALNSLSEDLQRLQQCNLDILAIDSLES